MPGTKKGIQKYLKTFELMVDQAIMLKLAFHSGP